MLIEDRKLGTSGDRLRVPNRVGVAKVTQKLKAFEAKNGVRIIIRSSKRDWLSNASNASLHRPNLLQ